MRTNYLIVSVVMLGFFAISFITNILGPLMPQATIDLHLSLSQAGILPFAFFIAYLISIPAGYALERFESKKIIIFAFLLGSLGSFIFCLNPNYITYIVSLFIIGASAAILQVAFWPLLRVAGGEENYSFYSVLTQMFFGAASFLSPFILSYLILNLPYSGNENIILSIFSKLTNSSFGWVSIYWLNFIIMLSVILFISFIKFPKVELKSDEKLEGFKTIKNLFRNKIVILYFFGIFAYVGQEQGISVWISQFLHTYHGVDPNTIGDTVVAMFWIMQSVGSILGIVLLKLYDVRKILRIFLFLQILALLIALFAAKEVSIIAFPICGFLTSVMYGSIFSLGMNSLKSNHGSVSGIFCTGIIGGAIVPLIVGGIGDVFGLRVGMCFIFITILFLLYISIIAKPLVNNKTVNIKELFSKS